MGKLLRWAGMALAALLISACEPAGYTGAPSAPDIPSSFDFYVLALSWSPGYCESEGANADRGQCATGRAYDFVLHGLWPQYERGYPSDCQSDHDGAVSADLVRSMLDIMPAPGLVRHQRPRGQQTTEPRESDAKAGLAMPVAVELAGRVWLGVQG